MAQRICSIDDCGKSAVARGWCDAHYRRWQRNGDPLAVARPGPLTGMCSIDDCDNPVQRRNGWCRAHHERWRATGDVQAHIPLQGRRPERCSLEQCEGKTFARTWCKRHYRHWQDYGDPLASSPTEPCAWPGCDKLVWIAKSRTRMCDPHANVMRRRSNRVRFNEKARVRNRRYARQYPEKVSAWNKKWRDANPDKQREYRLERHARVRGQFVERVYRSVLFERDNGRCGLCGKKVDPANWHMDHIVPLLHGGEHSYANVQVTHPFCNESKGARLIEHQMALL
jgi:5-methylcytosine-specific restriction endonuclease McrA